MIAEDPSSLIQPDGGAAIDVSADYADGAQDGAEYGSAENVVLNVLGVVTDLRKEIKVGDQIRVKLFGQADWVSCIVTASAADSSSFRLTASSRAGSSGRRVML